MCDPIHHICYCGCFKYKGRNKSCRARDRKSEIYPIVIINLANPFSNVYYFGGDVFALPQKLFSGHRKSEENHGQAF